MGNQNQLGLNVLLLGSGGREHALTRSLMQCNGLQKLYALPGNPGMTREGAHRVAGDVMDFEHIGRVIREKEIHFVIVGPEAPLVGGIRDWIEGQNDLQGVRVLGPGKEGAQLEGSKWFAKEFMARHGIPTAQCRTFVKGETKAACDYLQTVPSPFVLKADGLAGGKGVLIEEDLHHAQEAVEQMLNGQFGTASERVVIEEFLQGIEVSVFAVVDGPRYVLLPEAKDYKRAHEGDQGPNTGGMGSVSPVSFCNAEFMKRVEELIVRPTVEGLCADGIPYRGFLFFGLMCSPQGYPSVVEYNVRLGDPESQVILPRVQGNLLALLWSAAGGYLDKGHIDKNFVNASYVSVSLVSGGYPGEYQVHYPIRITQQAGSAQGHLIHAGTQLNEKEELESAGGRVFSACGRGETLEEAIQNAYKQAACVEFRDMYHRDDIGMDLRCDASQE